MPNSMHDAAPLITDDDIRRAVSRSAFDAGMVYQLEGRVGALRAGESGHRVDATVRGGGRNSYRQSLRLVRDAGGRLLATGSCTCPVGWGCKHIAAVLLEYQEQTVWTATAEAAHTVPPSLPVDSPHQPAFAPRLFTVEPASAGLPLPYEVDTWLRSLDAAQEEETEAYPPSVRKRLLYVLDRGAQSGDLLVSLQSIDVKRSGTLVGPAKRHQPDQLLRPGQQPKYLRPSDRTLIRQLARYRPDDGDELAGIVQAIIATGRGRWADWNGPALTEGPLVQAALEWRLDSFGNQRPELNLPVPLLLVRLPAPWYVDPATGAAGPVETTLPARLIQAMLTSPALPPSVAARVRKELTQRWPHQDLPAPKPLAPPQVVREALQPHLLLLTGTLPFDPSAIAAAGRYRPPPATGPHSAALARLSWRYGPVSLPSELHDRPERLVQQDGVLFQVVRDRNAEQRAAAAMRQLGVERISHYHRIAAAHPHAADHFMLDPDPGAWIDLVTVDVPRLRAENWLVEISREFPWHVVEPSGPVTVEVRERSGIDWFDLDLGVVVDKQRIALAPTLLDLIAGTGAQAVADLLAPSDDARAPLLLPLPDGRLLSVPFAQLRPILAPLLELFSGAELDKESSALRLPRRHAGDLALLEAASTEGGIAWAGGEGVRALGRQLREHGGIPPCAVPEGFAAALRPYQERGLAWLQFLRAAGLGGVLADDMGLGKTVQALAHLAVEQAQGRMDLPSLVICPTSLVPNWLAEATRFAPGLRVLVLHGPDRAERFGAVAAHDLVITTYPLLARDHAVLTAQDWHVVLLDEAQTIKNPLAATSKLARSLRARQRLCLSGTPLENHLGELWSLFDFLLPGLLGSRQQFGTRYRGPIEKSGNADRQALLSQRVAPFLLRRTKEQVAADLPAKTEIAEPVEMGEEQRAIYEGIRLAMHAKVRAAVARRGMAGSGIVILDALLKLRQACCDPRLLKLSAAKVAKAPSAKLERLLELLPQMLAEGRRVLLFSQFTAMLALIEAELGKLGLPYALLTGDTRDRSAPVSRFQAGEVPLFLISLKAGGTGLNLTAADTVIHYDPWWNPAVENQATDRAHRIGQDKPVFVHRLITVGSIEEKMEVLKQRKQALSDSMLGAHVADALTLSEGDLDMLFAPMTG